MSEPTLYEAAYILDPSLSDEETEEVISAIEAATEETGAEVVDTRDFRTRRLAYPINGFTHGSYKLLYFYGTGDEVPEVRTEISIRKPVIRARVFVANPAAIVGGLGDEEDEEEEAAERAEAVEAEAAKEAAEVEETEEAEEAEEAIEAPATEDEPEAEGDESPSEADETVEADETPETEE
jgi:ribosomal protein S6